MRQAMLLLLPLCMLGIAQLQGNAAAPQSILFIGNSYTYVHCLPLIIQGLARAGSQRLDAHMQTIGGATLESLWLAPQVQQALKERQWDFVVLQEQSLMPLGNPPLFLRYGKTFADAAAKAGSQVIFYETWARKVNPETQPELSHAYRQAAQQSGARLAPVGDAWALARNKHPQIELFDADGSHPSQAGAYLSACVFYAVLYHKSPAGLPGRIEASVQGKTLHLVDLPAKDAATLQAVAWTVVNAAKAWNPVN